MTFSITLTGWEDGARVARTLEEPDRWAVHSAERLSVRLAEGLEVEIAQQPQSISAKRVGVGAVLWDGAMALGAYLAQQPRHRYIGMKCIELGAGVGLTGLALAKMGAKVVLTDKEVVLPLLRENARLNGFDPDTTPRQGEPSATVTALEWGTPEGVAATKTLALGGVDLVVAADVCYVDGDGVSPSSLAFVETCAALCRGGGDGNGGDSNSNGGSCINVGAAVNPGARVLLAQELRYSAVRDALVGAAREHFGCVRKLPTSAVPAAFRAEHMELYELYN